MKKAVITMEFKIKRLRPNAILPRRATVGSAGMDLYALLEQDVVIPAGGRALIPTGLAISLPSRDYAAMIFPRSGLANRFGIALSNCVGVVDSDYRGEILVSLCNHGYEAYTVHSGDRIAQMVILPVILPEWEECDTLDDTARGTGGYGSTGRR